MKRIPVRDPGTAIVRAVQGRSKLELAHRIWRATGLYSWVARGVVDFIIAEVFEVWPTVRGNMIAMELKIRPNKIKPGSKQKEFMEAAEARGWLTGVCHSMDEVTGFLKAVRPLNGRTIERCGLNKTPPKP